MAFTAKDAHDAAVNHWQARASAKKAEEERKKAEFEQAIEEARAHEIVKSQLDKGLVNIAAAADCGGTFISVPTAGLGYSERVALMREFQSMGFQINRTRAGQGFDVSWWSKGIDDLKLEAGESD